MKANDEIPEDEMLLAEALAAANDHGLTWTSDRYFADADEGDISVARYEEASSCCAIGAIHIAKNSAFIDLTERDIRAIGLEPARVVYGNDHDGWMREPGKDQDRGESLGWAFRCAMTQEESDPTTEHLLREKAGRG